MPDNPSSTSSGPTFNPLDSRNWISESTVSSTKAGVSNPSGAPSGSPAFCELYLSLYPKAVGCSSLGYPNNFTVRGEANNSGCCLSLTLPDGTIIEGCDYIIANYSPESADCGNEIKFELTGQCSEKPEVKVEKKGKVFDVVFSVEEWVPKVAAPDSYDMFTLATPGGLPNLFAPAVNFVQVPEFKDPKLGLFTAKTKVKIDVKPAPNGKKEKQLADKLCQDWTLEIFQTIVEPTSLVARRGGIYNESLVFNPPLPIADGRKPEAKPISFKGAGDKKARSNEDTPRTGIRCDYVMSGKPGPGVPHPPFAVDLDTLHRKSTFATWVIVRNTKTGEERVLAWCEWMFDFKIRANIKKNPPPITVTFDWITKESNILGSGLGPGHTPVVRKPTRSPENPAWEITEAP